VVQPSIKGVRSGHEESIPTAVLKAVFANLNFQGWICLEGALMKRSFFVFFGLLMAVLSVQVRADAVPGSPAPAFTLTDTLGKPVSLSDFKGRLVVLEWVNHGCPFVRKHYGAGNMQSLQKSFREQGVVWLSIQSTNPDHQDYQAPAALEQTMRKSGAAQHATLMDPEGKVGRLYGAKVTPQLYLIDQAGILRYAGAIDNIRSTDQADIARARNYIAAALDAVLAGRTVADRRTTAYGCTIKYR
jgi:peroxiredoxin